MKKEIFISQNNSFREIMERIDEALCEYRQNRKVPMVISTNSKCLRKIIAGKIDPNHDEDVEVVLVEAATC